jgi:hypothetical protein
MENRALVRRADKALARGITHKQHVILGYGARCGEAGTVSRRVRATLHGRVQSGEARRSRATWRLLEIGCMADIREHLTAVQCHR